MEVNGSSEMEEGGRESDESKMRVRCALKVGTADHGILKRRSRKKKGLKSSYT